MSTLKALGFTLLFIAGVLGAVFAAPFIGIILLALVTYYGVKYDLDEKDNP